MAKAPKRPVKDEDDEQSRRFIKTAKSLKADGDLNLTEAEEAFEKTFRAVVRPVKKDESGNSED